MRNRFVAAGRAAVAAGAKAVRPGSLGNKHGAGRHLVPRARGWAYRVLRRHPSLDVDDSTLADRVRSSIGPLEKRLESPRIHVTVEHGVAILHGEVPSADAAQQLEAAVRAVAGVRDVRSHLSP
jgi:hypothetical protein